MSEPARNSGASGGDPFGKVLGQGRGLNDPARLVTQLEHSNDALAKAAAELQAAQTRELVLQHEVARLTADLKEAQLERKNAIELANQAELREGEACEERDRARYAAMRSGQRDPAPNRTWEQVHHGPWTPGRPYLSYQHVWHPKTGDCYRTDKAGAPAGEVPGTGRHWEACMANDKCPRPKPVPTDQLDPVLDGQAVRQTELWWDKQHVAWKVREISDDYLENIIGFLRASARRMCAREADWEVPFVPCPISAYQSPAAWLADTPLMRSLLKERRRRQAAARRSTTGQAGWS